MNDRIKILVVDDSPTVIKMLESIFSDEKDMEVIGHAKNGKHAVEMIHKLEPDVITMDIHMPEMDGFSATRMIMSTLPRPIVIISSSVDRGEVPIAFRALEEGAVSVIEKPNLADPKKFEAGCREIVNTVRAMSEIKVIKRRYTLNNLNKELIFNTKIEDDLNYYEVVVIASSTGGPIALQTILANLPVNFPIPIVVVQHISKGFLHGLVDWLDKSTLNKVVVAENGQALQAGTVYFAPDNTHLGIRRKDTKLYATSVDQGPVRGFRPSADVLFKSVAEVCGSHAIGCVLTGMGSDGAEGLLAMRQAGAATIAQDRESSTVFGMPAVAKDINAAGKILNLEKIPEYLVNRARQQHVN